MADLGKHGLDLMAQFEAGPGGGLATKAYECSGGRYTLGLGATTWPDGSPIKPYDICSMDQAIYLTNWHVRRFADVVDKSVKVPVTTNERDAMIMLAYNIGPEAFAECSVVGRLNTKPKDREYAAEAFAMWCKATNDTPDDSDLDEAFYQEIIGKNAKGQACWIGPVINPPAGFDVVREGGQFVGVNPKNPAERVPLGAKPVDYQKAMPGLLRRHLSGGCLFLGLDWRQACRKPTVSITSRRVWDSRDKRWEDIVSKKTEMADVLTMARGYPLTESGVAADAILFDPAPAQPEPAPVAVAPIPDSAIAIPDTPAAKAPQPDANAGQPESKPPSPAPAAPAPQNPAATVSGPAAGPAGKAAPSPPVAIPKVAEKPKEPVRVPDPPLPPKPLPPSVAVNPSNADMGPGLRNMFRSKRFYGGLLMVVGRVIIVADATGHFAEPIRAVIGDGILMDWTTGLLVNLVGELILDRGEKKATAPMGTPKEIALYTQPPVRS